MLGVRRTPDDNMDDWQHGVAGNFMNPNLLGEGRHRTPMP